jgi:hypothetical protein
MQKTCKLSGWQFEVSEMEMNLIKKMDLGEPQFHPTVRSAMRLGFRNERNLFIRKCDFSGERILSVYSENKPFPVYKYDYWIGDEWTPPELDYDFNKPFFEQYAELSKLTPRINLFTVYNENCDYCNAAEKNKNCYMHTLSDRSEDCYYTHAIFTCKDCIDSAYLYDSELCYECVDCRKAYGCRMCFLSDNCSNCNFCFDMRGCNDCFLCSGLRNKKFCINNEQLSEEEYKKKMSEINFGSYKVFSYLTDDFINRILAGKPYVRMINNENSTGNFLINTKNCHVCFDLEDCEDCAYFRIGANGCKDVIDCHAVVDGTQLLYNNVSTTEGYNSHNVIGCWTTKDSAYGEFLQGCKNCIGCISLRYKKNCILNKQYDDAEFKRIAAHIKDGMGDYWGNPFPFELAPFTYMESAFRDYETLEREDVEKIGWRYGEEADVEKGEHEDVNQIPDNIDDFEASKIDTVFLCERSHKAFKIVPQELRLLKKIQAPAPRFHHETRYEDRVKFRKSASH